MWKFRTIITIIAVACISCAAAQDLVLIDSIPVAEVVKSDTVVTPVKKKNLWQSIKNYLALDGGNKTGSDLNKVNVLGGPLL